MTPCTNPVTVEEASSLRLASAVFHAFSAHIAHHPLVALDVDGVCVGNIVLFILFFHLYFKSAL